ncbi:MAG TPA: hypothetical protein VFQ40_07410 [Actinomycetota bacterium]|nr:hypothetical protein [Actinomycetota bacterium]
MAVLTLATDPPGRGGTAPVFTDGPGRKKMVYGSLAFDNSYPTGGEDISEAFNLLRGGVARVAIVDQPIQAGAQTGKFAKINKATKKVQLFTNASPFAEVANASDQSLITGLDFVLVGDA